MFQSTAGRIFRSPFRILLCKRSSQSSTIPNKPLVEKLILPLLENENRTSGRIKVNHIDICGKPANITDRGGRTTKNSLPPSLQYVKDLMDKYSEYVVLTQIGSFYELYFEHAERYAPKLNITLTYREYQHGKVPFAGFPVEQVGRHLKVLIKEYGYSVAIADQFKTRSMADNEQKIYRRVTRIVTPGTYIDEAFENLNENQFLLNIEFPENCFERLADASTRIGLCWCDISTGELFVQQVILRDLVSAITRIRPKEVLLDEELVKYQIPDGEWYPELTELKKYFIKYHKLPSRYRSIDSFYYLFTSGESNATKKEFDIVLNSLSQKETASLRNTLIYIDEHLPYVAVNLQFPQRQLTTSIMQIDSRTSSALELHSTIRDNLRKGSLLSTIRRTVTSPGTRLLTQWLSAPSMQLDELQRRQTLIKIFIDNWFGTQTLIGNIKSTVDMSRLLQKFSFGKGDARELLQISESLKKASVISDNFKELLTEAKIPKDTKKFFEDMSSTLSFEHSISDKIIDLIDNSRLSQDERVIDSKSIPDDGEAAVSESFVRKSKPGVLNPIASRKLGQLHKERDTFIEKQKSLLSAYQDLFLNNFKARQIELKKLKKDNDPAIYVSGGAASIKNIVEYVKEGGLLQNQKFQIIRRSSNTCWLSHSPWEDLGRSIKISELEILTEEEFLLNNLKQEIVQHSSQIRQISQTIDYLDVLSSFSVLALEKNLVCPKLEYSGKLEIIGGRHLVVEDGLQSRSLKNFTDNDCNVDSGNLWVITGPNMGGKSTFLRQTAIIVLLAQIGCYVPCDSARIGLVDKIFSRVGSADDLYNDMSTFMVEMIETGFILKGATKNSLAILDEIGRGTSAKDGIGIAFATLKYLLEHNKCRTLFATHFGNELFHLVQTKFNKESQEKVHFYRTGIVEGKNSFYYDHKIRKGVCRNSDAVRVAQLSGFPEEAITVAKEVLTNS
ncbi:mismatch repair ATPase MSH1 Ecym_8198 [Eremothecium cymbalariae DBVPG|uniref:DNA mismatch repair proteins mutS family domain-containing protein n=1 Tax=Eremothecium cymbalariae (strain CBS 270.75 / DBVPG 7215 / KCTC 17166 / NRRL Y-17582) TaxID=931890 RepID=G8JXA9_ERECY|nr:Hypothetical protein Ecym_8198 [Eremothecium cymbalariae DBVPG\